MFGALTRRLLVVVGLVLVSLGTVLPVAAAPTPCANLIVTGFSISPDPAIAEHPATLSISVQNTGTCSTNIAFVVQWKQSSSSPTGPSVSVGPLASGASTTFTLPYTFAKGGNFQSVVTVDTGRAIAETNEVDNVQIFPITVLPNTTDLVITNFQILPPVVQGFDSTAQITVQNTGNTDSGAFQVAWKPITGMDPLTQPLDNLVAGGTHTFTFTFAYPDIGTFWSQATVDAARQVKETNEFNNSAFTKFTVDPALPDLVVSGISFNPPNPIAGQNVQVTVMVTNQGHVSTGNSFTVQWVPGEKPLPLSQTAGPLAAGASTPVVFNYVYKSDGSFTTTATVDSNNTIFEISEDNNTGSQPVDVGPSSIDLTIDNVVISPATPTQGVDATVTITVRNLGNSAAGPFTVSWNPDAFGISVPSLSTLTKQVAGLDAAGGANDHTDVVFTFAYPKPGAYHTVAQVDAFKDIKETNETNNLFTNDITVAPGNIDLIITQFSIDNTSPKRFEKVTATITVKNQGTLPVSFFQVEWKLSSTDITGKNSFIAGLNPGESKTVTISGVYFLAGTYSSTATVDPANKIPEPGGGELNNDATPITVTVQPLKP